MKKYLFLSVIVIAIAILNISSTNVAPNNLYAVKAAQQIIIKRIVSLDSFLTLYPNYFYKSNFSTREKKYEELSWYFKRAAGFLIYTSPKDYYENFISPFGFKENSREGFFGLIPDNFLFTGPIGNEFDSTLQKFSPQDIKEQQFFIQSSIEHYRAAIKKLEVAKRTSRMDASTIFDMLRMEMFRISTIDVANSDFIIDEAAMPSLNGSLDTWITITNEFVKLTPSLQVRWKLLSTSTKKFLLNNKSYREFNRMSFIKQSLIPLSKFLNDLQQSLAIPLIKTNSGIRNEASNIFDKDVFNADFFAPNPEATYTPERAALGELLFFEPLLSDNNRRACASCHKPELAFTDGRTKSMSFDLELLPRNSPTIINAGFQKHLFWDLRAASLEDQLDSVVNNVAEMHSSFDGVVSKLASSPEYVNLFSQAFPESEKITRTNIKNAIGVYERSLTGLNSRFDQYMRGDETKLSTDEISGFNLFMGKAKCGVCHTAPLFNGTVPPYFEVTDRHSIGVPLRDSMDKYVIDPDLGMMKMNGKAFDKFSFKTPTIRNAAVTAPYMHNGVFKTLEQVVDFYDHAGGNKFSNDMRVDMEGLPFFTLLPIELKLTPLEKTQVVLFIRTLTDTSASQRVPAKLPTLTGDYAKWNKRSVGGDY